MAHGKLNLPPFALPKDGVIPRGMLERFSRTIADWSRGIDSFLAKAHVTEFTPQLTAATANPNLGADGTAVGWHTIIGNTVVYQFVFTFAGAGIVQGTGIYAIGVPVGPKPIPSSSLISRGLVTVDDATVGVRRFSAHLTATDIRLRPINATAYAAAADITDATIGLTFAAGDSISGQVVYHHAD